MHAYVSLHCHSLLKGAVFGVLATGDALSALLSTVAWPNVYDTIINHNLSPGDTFMIMAGVGLLAIPLLLYVTKYPAFAITYHDKVHCTTTSL